MKVIAAAVLLLALWVVVLFVVVPWLDRLAAARRSSANARHRAPASRIVYADPIKPEPARGGAEVTDPESAERTQYIAPWSYSEDWWRDLHGKGGAS